jgi:hypothetical protein
VPSFSSSLSELISFQYSFGLSSLISSRLSKTFF